MVQNPVRFGGVLLLVFLGLESVVAIPIDGNGSKALKSSAPINIPPRSAGAGMKWFAANAGQGASLMQGLLIRNPAKVR
jgi:hypothetical protein